MTYPKRYFRPKTLAEAVERAARPGSLALAGGALTLGGITLPHATIVDLQDLAELKRFEVDSEGLHIGGASTLQDVVGSALVPDELKRSLRRAIPLNIRNGASVGESLIVRDPPGEWLAVLVALDAQVEHAGRLDSPETASLWEQPLLEFVHYLYLHQHPYQGIITQLRIPPVKHTAIGAAFVARTPADLPIVNAAVAVTLGGNGIVNAAAAICGASPEPVIALELTPLVGSAPDDERIARSLELVASSVNPIGDYRGSIEYRLQMAQVMVRRALLECIERAGA